MTVNKKKIYIEVKKAYQMKMLIIDLTKIPMTNIIKMHLLQQVRT